MLIELPSKEVKELFEGDFTQTSGSQRKDDHHPHPPRASFSASIPTRLQRAPCTHTHSHTRTRAHERGRSTAAPRSSGQPRPVPCPDTGTARPPRCPARLNARGHGGKRPAAARSTPAIPSGRGSALPRSPLHPTFPAALPEGRPPRPQRAARASRRAARCPPLPLWELRPAPAVLTVRPGLRLKVRRSRAPSGSACERREETLPVLTLCLHDSQRLRDGIYDFQYAALHAPTPALKAPLDVVFRAVSLTGMAASTAGEVIVLCVREERCHALGSSTAHGQRRGAQGQRDNPAAGRRNRLHSAARIDPSWTRCSGLKASV